MALFMGFHNMGQVVTEEEMKEIFEKYKAAASAHGAEAKGVYFNGEAGRAFCVTEAESAADVDAAHADVGKPTDELVQVQKLN